MNKLILVILLITYSICDDCTSLATESTCTAKSGCKWTAAPACTGDDSCTAKKTSESECKETQYTSKVACTFTAATPTCTGDSTCTSGATSSSDCTAIKYGGNVCTYNENKTCTGGTECASVTSLEDNTACIGTKYGQSTCAYKVGTCAGNDGNAACSAVEDLSSATACEGTSYDGPEVNCTYVAGTCSADTGKDGNDNSCGIIKFQFYFLSYVYYFKKIIIFSNRINNFLRLFN